MVQGLAPVGSEAGLVLEWVAAGSVAHHHELTVLVFHRHSDLRYAEVFDSPSVDLGGFREVVRPGAFGDLDGRDIQALVNHDLGLVTGRITNEVDTRLLQKDRTGLVVKIRPRTIPELPSSGTRRGPI